MLVIIAVLRPLLLVHPTKVLWLVIVTIIVTCLRDLETVSLALLRFLHPPGIPLRLTIRLLASLLTVMDILFVLKLP